MYNCVASIVEGKNFQYLAATSKNTVMISMLTGYKKLGYGESILIISTVLPLFCRSKKPAISPVEEEDDAALLAEAEHSTDGAVHGATEEVTGTSALRVRHHSDSDSSKCSLQLGATAATITDEDPNKGNYSGFSSRMGDCKIFKWLKNVFEH